MALMEISILQLYERASLPLVNTQGAYTGSFSRSRRRHEAPHLDGRRPAARRAARARVTDSLTRPRWSPRGQSTSAASAAAISTAVVAEGEQVIAVLEGVGRSGAACRADAPRGPVPRRAVDRRRQAAAVERPARPLGWAESARARQRAPRRDAGLVHRLDRETSGITVFGKTREATRALAALFREHRVKKKYVAVVRAELPASGTIDLPLSRDPSRPGRWRATKKANGLAAVTRFERLAARSSRCTPRLAARISCARTSPRSARPSSEIASTAETRLPAVPAARAAARARWRPRGRSAAARRPAQVLRHMMARALRRMRRVESSRNPIRTLTSLARPRDDAPHCGSAFPKGLRPLPPAQRALAGGCRAGGRHRHLAPKGAARRACGAAARARRSGRALCAFATAPPLSPARRGAHRLRAALFFAARVATYEEAPRCAGPS